MYPARSEPPPSPDAADGGGLRDRFQIARRPEHGGCVLPTVRLERDDGAVAEPQGAVRGQLARDVGRPRVDGCQQPASCSEDAPVRLVHVSGQLHLPQLLVEPPQQLIGRIAAKRRAGSGLEPRSRAAARPARATERRSRSRSRWDRETRTRARRGGQPRFQFRNASSRSCSASGDSASSGMRPTTSIVRRI